MTSFSEFWDVLAPHHEAIENNYFDLASIRALTDAIHQPVLVVGAGHGLIVAELRKLGFQCDGVDFSSEMIRQAKLRRGLNLVKADAKALPFGAGSYGTIIYATGVVDFMGDEEEIRAILKEGGRVAKPAGNIFVAFYRVSRAGECFLGRVGLLKNNVVSLKRSFEMYLLNPAEMVAWVANQTGISHLRAAMMLFSLITRNTMREKALTFRMQKIFRNPEVARALLNAAPEEQPYRNEAEIRNLFRRLAIPIRHVKALHSCWVVRI
jgi:2-polyprenyl-3-methyl-5-hydroxy-6-metoxy-1,4-benzoquinol methylase